MNSRNLNSISKRRQKGAALVIALIIMLVMTLLGVTGLQMTTLQERMAGNMTNQNVAFQGADSCAASARDNVATVNVSSSTWDAWLDNIYIGGGTAKAKYSATRRRSMWHQETAIGQVGIAPPRQGISGASGSNMRRIYGEARCVIAGGGLSNAKSQIRQGVYHEIPKVGS